MFAETDTVHAEITLTNTGDRKGTEVVQLYIGDIVTSYSWTDRELKAFQRVELEPGESKTVAFDIPVSDCTIVILKLTESLSRANSKCLSVTPAAAKT